MNHLNLQPDETGNIPTPFAYLNPESRDWRGADEEDGESDGYDDLDAGGGILAPFQPIPEDNGGGEEVDEDEYEDEDDNDRGFGFMAGIGLALGYQGQPRFA